MSLHWGGFRAKTAFRPEPLICGQCRNDEFLEFTSIDSLPGNTRSVVEATNVLAFGGHYIHCGQPMTSAGAEMHSIHGTYRGGNLPDALGVYLATRVLRCECGFQMEIPDQYRSGGLDGGGPDGGQDGLDGRAAG